MDFLTTQWSALAGWQWAGNTGQQWLTAAASFVGIAALLQAGRWLATHNLREAAQHSVTKVDDALLNFAVRSSGLLTVTALYFSMKLLTVPEPLRPYVRALFVMLFTFQGIRILQEVLLQAVRVIWFRKRPNVEHLLMFVDLGIRLVLWSLAILFVLSNLGVNVTSLVAGLGIGGIAIGFALQKILTDVFASFAISMDQPFRAGDYISAGPDMSGTVTKIGIRSTRIQALGGEEVIVPNEDLSKARIQNYGRMTKRRVQFSFGVARGTEVAKLRMVPDLVREAFQAEEHARLDRVHLKELGETSFLYEVVYFADSADYLLYMDMQQRINLEIVERLAKHGIALAMPVRKVWAFGDAPTVDAGSAA